MLRLRHRTNREPHPVEQPARGSSVEELVDKPQVRVRVQGPRRSEPGHTPEREQPGPGPQSPMQVARRLADRPAERGLRHTVLERPVLARRPQWVHRTTGLLTLAHSSNQPPVRRVLLRALTALRQAVRIEPAEEPERTAAAASPERVQPKRAAVGRQRAAVPIAIGGQPRPVAGLADLSAALLGRAYPKCLLPGARPGGRAR